MENEQAFLGTGWSFPPEFKKITKSVIMISDEEDIKSSLEILLSTKIGERVMLPKYGCNVDELLFNPLNTTLKTFVSELIRTAILYHEPRIDVEKIDISQGDDLSGELILSLDYKIRATNSRTNMVYPFYKLEGTNI
ncbi:GPW/gp25 family protein [Flavobacterium sp. MC2016-06]|jgi:phage baseplate assembly protein W|uniref:GPW/gp25 family protein n=1 Tax=Flavobacterium sp. MC2016-06 TaxID=2676308 RepID=UPI0012BA8EB7|nr:GPW/gp25 family protein [Flavobacterium sp. MC2016-06]MBU3857623.1 GPW/gp25 family protein [Flavobacterium sp. MC2016-06]